LGSPNPLPRRPLAHSPEGSPPPGFEKPSAIQQRAIKPIISGRDVIGQAQSGTGKTATFSISALQCIDTQTRYKRPPVQSSATPP